MPNKSETDRTKNQDKMEQDKGQATQGSHKGSQPGQRSGQQGGQGDKKGKQDR